MSEENKALFRRFIDEVMGNKNLAVLDELIAPDFVDHNPMPGTAGGREGMKQGMTMFFAAFPDLKSTIGEMIAEGDKVVGVMTTTGTHKGDLMGIPASGKQVSFSEIHMVRIANGKAVEHWGLADDMAMMQQIGAIPAP